jgi:hypothetical protein
MAERYRVKSLIHFLEGCLSAEEKRTYRGSQVLFRVYEDWGSRRCPARMI